MNIVYWLLLAAIFSVVVGVVLGRLLPSKDASQSNARPTKAFPALPDEFD